MAFATQGLPVAATQLRSCPMFSFLRIGMREAETLKAVAFAMARLLLPLLFLLAQAARQTQVRASPHRRGSKRDILTLWPMAKCGGGLIKSITKPVIL